MLQINVCILNKVDWLEWKKIAGDIADTSYEDYLLCNKNENELLKKQGYKIKEIPFDKVDFEKFCKERALAHTTPREIIKARSEWAAFFYLKK